MSNNFVKIEKKNKIQIIFKPLRKPVTQFTYAKIKIHFDLQPLNEEVLNACQTALLLNNYLKDYKARANTYIKRYLNEMQADILQICINYTKKLNDISTIFGLEVEIESDPKLKSILEKRNKKKKENRKRAISDSGSNSCDIVVSYYTVSQLTNMTGSDKNDVLNNQNHVVKALQGEHNKLAKKETDVKRLLWV